MRQALNEEISNTLSNEKSALGQAVLKFEQSYKILRLFLEFIFPNSMHNQNSLLLSLLHNDSVIYNRQKLLAYLGGDKSIFVADNFISDASILAAQLLCLFLLPSQVHSHTSRLDELQGNLVQAYDYFAPYQGGVPGDKPSVQQQNQMLQLKNMLLTKLDEANSRLMDRLEALDLLPDEQRSKELKSVKDTRECFNKFKGEFNVVEQEFNNGIIPFNKAQEKLRTSKTLSLMASELQKDLFNTLVPIQATPSIKSKQNFTSSITTKSQSFFSNEFMTRSNSFVSSEPSGSKKTSRKSTAGDGDCAFHALLGELEDNQYKCKDLMAKRKRVADAIRSGKKGDKIFPLIVSGISHIIDYGNRDFIQEHFDMIKDNESHFKAIQTNYRNWDAKKVGAVQLCKNELEECLRKHSDILEFIDAQYLRLKQVSGKEANLQESLWNKYDYVKNEEKDGELLKKIQAIPELSEKSIKHKLEVDRAFPWEDEVQKNSGVLDEYAKRIEQVGNCLLPHEIGIIAYVFDKCAKVYTTDPGTDKMVGLESYNDNGNNEKIEVSFDGFGHFERVENGTHLFHNL